MPASVLTQSIHSPPDPFFPCSQYTLDAWSFLDSDYLSLRLTGRHTHRWSRRQACVHLSTSTRGRLTARSLCQPITFHLYTPPMYGRPPIVAPPAAHGHPMECGGPQTPLWPPKADVYADSSRSPQKTQSRPRKMRHRRRRLTVAYHTSPPLLRAFCPRFTLLSGVQSTNGRLHRPSVRS